MNKEEYGKQFMEHLLEQYKLYVESTDRVSDRRERTNRFYVSLLSGLIVLLSITVSKQSILDNFQIIVFLIVGLLGTGLCILWELNILSYRRLNSGKFKVIHEMEEYLPFRCYDREWEILGKGKDRAKYLKLTWVEQYVPVVLSIPYVLLFLYSIYRLIKCVW